ncbi:MAG: hypothetical protein ACI4WS_09015 [Oscillospiraceae bacterium]
MKKLIAAAAATLLTIGLCGCSGSPDPASAVMTVQENGTAVTAAGIKLTFPEDWTVYAGDAVYETLYENSSGEYDSLEDFKSSYDENGLSYLMYAGNSDQTAMMTFTALKITTDEVGRRSTAEEFARSNHDTGVISFQSSGYQIKNSGFTAETISGKSGWLSQYEIHTDEDAPQLIMGQSEFIFEQDGFFYSLQSYYHSPEAGEQISAVLAGISAV